MNNPKRIEGLDTLRGLAAIYVMIFHTFLIGCVYIHEGIIKTIIMHGHIGVPLFFILSGFSIIYSSDKPDFFSEEGITKFYLRRLFRIVPLFYLLLICHIVLKLFSFQYGISFIDLILTATFLFPFFYGHHESLVMAGWSIGIEMIFYLFFPFLLTLTKRNSKLIYIISVVAACIFLCCSSIADSGIEESGRFLNFGFYFVFFLSGIFFYIIIIEKRKFWLNNFYSMVLIFLGVVILLIGMLINKEHPFGFYELPATIMISLGAIFLESKFFVNRITRYFGDISYSIYLIHPIVIILLLKLRVNIYVYANFPHQGYWIYILLVCSIVFLFASLTYEFFEKPFIALGKKIINGMNQ